MTGVTGVGPLVRLAVRRDRVLLPVWAVLLAGMAGLSASATVGLYPDLASRVQAAQNINATSSLVGLYGRIYDVTALGALATIKLGGFGAALLGVLGLVLIVRHTRAEEEAGRLELVGAGVVGRYAALTAALLVTTTAVVAIGALTSGALIAAGSPSSGSIAFGLSWAGTGIAFAAVGAVAAQMTTSARGAIGAAGATLGLAYLLRGSGTAPIRTGCGGCRGCHPSAGPSRSGPTPATAGCCSHRCWPSPSPPRLWRTSSSPGATSAPAC